MKPFANNGLPPGWGEASIGEMTAPGITQAPPIGDGDFTYIDISSIDSRSKRIVEAKQLKCAEAPSRARQALSPNDVLVSMTRPNLNAVAYVDGQYEGAIGSTGFHVLRSEAIDSEWLYYLVQTARFVEEMTRLTQGALYPAVRPKDIAQFRTPLPPLREQSRIVAEIEKQFSRLDAGVAALKRVEANLRRYKAAVLKAACEGRLTTAWRAAHPDVEPASELLKRILRDRRRRWEDADLAKMLAKGKPPKDDRWKERYEEPIGPDLTDCLGIPPGWEVASIDQLTSTITSGSRDWSKYYGRGTGTFIMAQNVRPGQLEWASRQAVDPPVGDRDRARSQVLRNDLLVTIVGANTGNVCRVPDDLPDHYVCQSVSLMRPVDVSISRYWEMYMIASEGGQRHFRRYIYGQGRPHLSFDQIRMTPVPLPPSEEQAVIVNAVEDFLSVAHAITEAGSVNLRRASSLRQSILRDAFEGKLVEQDPADEPASVLLERIRAVREKAQRPAKEGGRKAVRNNFHKT